MVRSIKLTTCDRCAEETKATTSERVTWHDQVYEIDLCEKHADMMQRDFWGWLRNAREAGVPGVSVWDKAWSPFERRSVTRAFTDSPRAVSAVDSPKDAPLTARSPLPATAHLWTFTRHAEERLAERGPIYGFGRYEVLMAVAEPEVVVSSRQHDGTEVRQRGTVRVVVNPDACTILTVKEKKLSDDTIEAEAGQRSAG